MQYGLPLAEAVPLFAALLSLPLTADYAPLTVSPEQQKQQTLQALLTILLRIAAQQPVLFVMEDLHWVDPSTLELLSLLVDQGPTARILALLTFRPDFSPPWTGRSHLTQVTLPRLPRRQAAEMTGQVAHGKALPAEVVEQVVAKTDGVPLFVEELTKMVLESGLLQEREERYELTGPLPPLAIPATLHDSLMARLDRLATVKGLAQLGATLGREFSYELLQAVSPWDEETLQRGLQQLVEAEFLYQQGLPPQATYLFKHALIQDAAYQSLLRAPASSTISALPRCWRRSFPRSSRPSPSCWRITTPRRASARRPSPTGSGQASAPSSARPIWKRSATSPRGWSCSRPCRTPPSAPSKNSTLQIALGPALMATKGYAAPEVEQAYARARELCQQVGETPQLFPVLRGLWEFYLMRGRSYRRRGSWAEQLLSLAQQRPRPGAPPGGPPVRWGTPCSVWASSPLPERTWSRALPSTIPSSTAPMPSSMGRTPGWSASSYAAWALWYLGYPDQALQRSHEALTLAQELSHPFSLAFALAFAAMLHQFRREGQAAQERAEAADCARDRAGVSATGWRWGRSCGAGRWPSRDREQEGIAQMRQGLAAYRATGAELVRPYYLALLAEAYGKVGQAEEGLQRAGRGAGASGQNWGALLRGRAVSAQGRVAAGARHAEQHAEAEACFQQALDIARRQQAKSLELRAAMSLSRLWQQQGKRAEAHELLAPIYGWFTEGFDTADLQEAKALLEELQQ